MPRMKVTGVPDAATSPSADATNAPTSDGSYEQAYFYEGFESVREIISARDVIRIKVDLYSHGSVVFEFRPIGKSLPPNFKSPLM